MMLRQKMVLICAVMLAMAGIVRGDDDKAIAASALPAAVQEFVKTHFSGAQISSAKIDGDEYEVRLSSGCELEFTHAGEWKKVKCPGKAVPAAIVPAAVAKYVKEKHPGQDIREIKREKGGFETELANGAELKFNAEGVFLRNDD